MYLPLAVSYSPLYFIVNVRVEHLGKTVRTIRQATTSANGCISQIKQSEETSLVARD